MSLHSGSSSLEKPHQTETTDDSPTQTARTQRDPKSTPNGSIRTNKTTPMMDASEIGSSEADSPPASDQTTQDPEKGTQRPDANPSAATDWNGPDDADNPQNWSTAKKAFHTAATAALGFAVTCGSSLITPSTSEIADHFGVSRTAAILPLTLFVLGLGLGPMLAAPISETFGRSVVYKSSAPLFMLFILGAGFSNTFAGLLVCRLLAAVFGGPVLAVGAGTNADMYSAQNRALASSLFVMMPFLGPAIGPVIGGFAAQYKGWRWTQWCTIFIALAAAVPVFCMSETYKKVILRKRAKNLGLTLPTGPSPTRAQIAKQLFTVTLIRPLHMLATEPIVALFSLYTAFTFSVLFAFFAAYPYTFQNVYHFNTWQYGLTFLGIGLGVLLAVATAIVVNKFYYNRHHRRIVGEGKGAVPPEYRLLPAQMGCIGIPIGLFWWAWTANSSIHWISPVLAGIPFAWGNLCVFLSAALFFIDTYGALNGASAMAANGLLRYTMGAAFPLFTYQMYEKLGIGWATSLLGFISLAMLPIPWLFFKYGPQIRARSRYDTVKF